MFFVDVRREILEWDIQHCEHFTEGFWKRAYNGVHLGHNLFRMLPSCGYGRYLL
jgi:hypothetical protein